ncbi:monocarboxylate transporter 2-like isoform X4 [Daphnia pulicaria]|uniref:monocarboxylate transporter 2-like isoform X4 n=1 Tax=Daphnia pulicaria TaxID=35523 RepID=UPI001EEC9244|nr:monocarboxylate transporter 2-like isoform X4 [Daphnia pulicaria]
MDDKRLPLVAAANGNFDNAPTMVTRAALTLWCQYYLEGGWGWVVLGASVVSTMLTFGCQWTIVDYLSRTPAVVCNSSAVQKGALAALSLCVASLLSPVIVAWCRRKSTRLTAVFGGLLAALGLLFTSFASQFHQLFLSYGLILGVGVGLTRDTATLMVGQYFKRRREAVEIALVGSSGIGLALMTVFLHTTLGAIGWRLGLQAVTGLVLLTFILGSCYRSASLYHPQRRAILHLKNQRKKIKEKNKHEEKPPFFDFTSLKSRTIQTIMVSTASIAAGIYTPLIYLGYEAEKTQGRDSSMWLQVYIGLAWTLGCAAVGLLIVREPAECKIGRQYLCQAAGLLAALSLLSQAVVSTPWSSHSPISQQPTADGRYSLFCWVYGFGLGAYHYALKMFVYQRVRARNFARAWSFVQASQALPLVCGIPFTGFLSTEYGQETAYYASSAFVFSGSLALFIIDLRKYVLSHSHSHSHKHQHRKKQKGANRPRTPKVASEPNTDGAGGGSVVVDGEICRIDVDGIEVQPDEDEEDPCPPSCKSRIRRDSLAEEEINLPPLTLLQQTSLVLAQLGELPYGAAAAELTCISEEGIADMDIPDHLLEELDFAADCITSCDKVENYLMLSEYENNLIQQSSTSSTERKSRKSSIFRQIGQTFSGRYGSKGDYSERCLHAPSTHHFGHGNRRLSNVQRGGRDHCDSPLKMIQIHESNDAEGKAEGRV